MNDDLVRRLHEVERTVEQLVTRERPLTNIGARVYNTANQTHTTNGAWQSLTFDTPRYASTGMWAGGTPTRLTVSRAGVYLIAAGVRFQVQGTGSRFVRLRQNGATLIAQTGGIASSTFDSTFTVSTAALCAVGDFLEVQVFQDSGGPLTLLAAANSAPEFVMQRLV